MDGKGSARSAGGLEFDFRPDQIEYTVTQTATFPRNFEASFPDAKPKRWASSLVTRFNVTP